jgi:hypothetical protein
MQEASFEIMIRAGAALLSTLPAKSGRINAMPRELRIGRQPILGRRQAERTPPWMEENQLNHGLIVQRHGLPPLTASDLLRKPRSAKSEDTGLL